MASDELVEMLPAGTMTMDDANAIIMAARAHWFPEDETATEESSASENESATEAEPGADTEADTGKAPATDAEDPDSAPSSQ